MLPVVISGSLRSAYVATAAALDNRHGPADQDSHTSFSDRRAVRPVEAKPQDRSSPPWGRVPDHIDRRPAWPADAHYLYRDLP